VKIRMKYLKVFEDFIEKEELKKKNNSDEEIPVETIQDEDEVQGEDELDEVDQDEVETKLKKEKEDLLEEIQRYYRKNKRRK
jgi:hypothetical protein